MKKLIAAAVAAAVIAPASVMAAGPTLYGKIHSAVEMHDNNGSNLTGGTVANNGVKYDEWSLNSRASRIGVKGSEDLGNGMKVGYLIEWGVNMTGNNGNTDLSERNRAVTLSGDWGTMLWGKWDTPMKTLGRKVDIFGDRIGDNRNLNTFTTLDARAENVVAYVTPNMNGFTATVAYSFDAVSSERDDNGVQTGGQNSDSNAWSFNAIYNNGPLMAGVAYVDYSEGTFSVPSTQVQPINYPTAAANGCWNSTTVNNCENESAWRAAGSYKIGDFKILASYTDISNANGLDGADTNIWTLGGTYTMGNNVIKVQYGVRDELDDWKDATGAKQINSGDETGADMWSVGLDHKFSKRTTVYAMYSTMSNDDRSNGTSWSVNSAEGQAGSNGAGTSFEDADSFAVGIIHKF